MYASLLADARFHELLLDIDRKIADAARAEGCGRCGGCVHSARYPRKPHGRPKCLDGRLGPDHDRRFSFCCAVDGCRARKTPASVRFLGPRVFIATVVVLIAMLRRGASDARLAGLEHVVSLDRHTVERWRRWWRDTFTATPFWRIARAGFMPPVAHERLPASLLDRFDVMPEAGVQVVADEERERLVALLRFIAPITGGMSGELTNTHAR